jgi:hypothetical protein
VTANDLGSPVSRLGEGRARGGGISQRWVRWVPLKPTFAAALPFIDEARNAGGKALVTCRYGSSRSVAVVLAYLITREGATFDQALAFVRSARPEADPNAGFERYLRRLTPSSPVLPRDED